MSHRSSPPPSNPPAELGVRVLTQPTDSVCGPTCLHAVYRYLGLDITLDEVLREVRELPDGGTLAGQLGIHALQRGLRVVLYTNDLRTFDPTWFRRDVDIQTKLEQQLNQKQGQKLQLASRCYIDYLRLGGDLRLEPLTLDLLRSYIDRKLPVMAGLCATYLYDCPRETADGKFDDVAGHPTGHFVVIHGYDADTDHVLIADPLPGNLGFGDRYYRVEIHRLLAAIHLGIVTYDANLLVIERPT